MRMVKSDAILLYQEHVLYFDHISRYLLVHIKGTYNEPETHILIKRRAKTLYLISIRWTVP